jgi:hypothetical protein
MFGSTRFVSARFRALVRTTGGRLCLLVLSIPFILCLQQIYSLAIRPSDYNMCVYGSSEKREVLWHLLVDVDEAFRECNVSYMIIYGTLIGALRDQDILPWTHDVDLAVLDDRPFQSAVGDLLLRDDVRSELQRRRVFIASGAKPNSVQGVLCRRVERDSNAHSWFAMWLIELMQWNPHVGLYRVNKYEPDDAAPYSHWMADKCRYPIAWMAPWFTSQPRSSYRMAKIRDREFPIPMEAEKTLYAYFGEWRVPQKYGSRGVPEECDVPPEDTKPRVSKPS